MTSSTSCSTSLLKYLPSASSITVTSISKKVYKITEISLTGINQQPQITEPWSPTHIRASHVLIVNLSASEVVQDPDDPSFFYNLPKGTPLKEGGSLAERLKALVEKDLAAPEGDRIDMVVIGPTTTEEPPDRKTWLAMDGLCPKHLEVTAGMMDQGDIQYLDEFKTPWPLETLTVTGMMSDDDFFPQVTDSLRSLSMNFCRGADFLPGASLQGRGATNLEEFALMYMDECVSCFQGNNTFLILFAKIG